MTEGTGAALAGNRTVAMCFARLGIRPLEFVAEQYELLQQRVSALWLEMDGDAYRRSCYRTSLQRYIPDRLRAIRRELPKQRVGQFNRLISQNCRNRRARLVLPLFWRSARWEQDSFRWIVHLWVEQRSIIAALTSGHADQNMIASRQCQIENYGTFSDFGTISESITYENQLVMPLKRILGEVIMRHLNQRRPENGLGDDLQAINVMIAMPDTADLYESVIHSAAVMTIDKQVNHIFKSDVEVLTTTRGALLVIPHARIDATLLERVKQLLAQLYGSSMPVRIGITSGTVYRIAEPDGSQNFIGSPINAAARLVAAEHEAPCLVEEGAVKFLLGWGANHSGEFGPAEVVTGKRGETFNARQLLWDAGVSSKVSIDVGIVRDAQRTAAAVLVAFDLPEFSAGDPWQMVRRLRATKNAFQQIAHKLKVGELVYLPGGDGGVAVLHVSGSDGVRIAEEFQKLLLLESQDVTKPLDVRSRISIHYGPVQIFTNGGGIERPCGVNILIAEQLIGDAEGRSARYVISNELRESVASGSSTAFALLYRDLLPIKRNTFSLGRFTPQLTIAGVALPAAQPAPQPD